MQVQNPGMAVAVAATVALFGGSICTQGGKERSSDARDAGTEESGDAVETAATAAAPPAAVDVETPGLFGAVWGLGEPGELDSDAEGERDVDAGGGDAEDVEWNALDISGIEARARKRELAGLDYPWHDQPRRVDGEVECPEVELVEYDGDVIPYNRTVKVNPDFRDRLRRFEKIVRELAIEIYGRPPDRIVQNQSYGCKTVGRQGEELSEHAFGHAIDVGAFEFDAVDDERRETLGPAADAFTVSVSDHWDAEEGFAAKHRQFLHRLVRQLQRRGPFSTILGPGYPNHDPYFHFDFGPEFFFRP